MDKIIGEIIKETPNDTELGAKIRELYPQITKEEELSKEYLEHWTCDHCGEHTHEVDYDYLGNGTNHLGCELKDEIAALDYGVDVKASKERN